MRPCSDVAQCECGHVEISVDFRSCLSSLQQAHRSWQTRGHLAASTGSLIATTPVLYLVAFHAYAKSLFEPATFGYAPRLAHPKNNPATRAGFYITSREASRLLVDLSHRMRNTHLGGTAVVCLSHSDRVLVLLILRRRKANPSRPKPTSATVAGSGTVIDMSPSAV